MTGDHNLIFVEAGRIFHGGPGVRVLDLETCEVAWHGLLFMDHVAAGAESVREFARRACHDPARAAESLKGIYFLALRDKSSGTCWVFVDNSGLYHAYYSRHCAGTSFFQIAAQERLGPADLDSESLIELLHFGCIYSGKTLFSRIRKIGPDAVLRTSPEGRFELLRKKTPDISAKREQSFESMLESFCCSVAGESISLDLTGGIDSRLLAVVLDYFGLRFEVAASGIPGNQDLVIGEAVATCMGRELQVTYHDCQLTDWDRICEVCDGMFDPARASRPMQLQRDRARRGVALAIGGDGGELFKDFWWLQDFPWYRRRSPNLARLYDFRIASGALEHSYLSKPYRSRSETYRERLLGLLSQYADASNTRTYDRIYYSFKMQAVAGCFIKNALSCLQIYTPYLERDAVSTGYNLGRSQRFFNRYHRRIISRYSPRAARVPTTEGHMSASSDVSMLVRDLPRYVMDRWKRLQCKIGQKVSSRVSVQESPNDPRMPECLSGLLEERRSMERLKDAGILNPALRLRDLRKGYLGPLFALDWSLEKLEQNQRDTTAVLAEAYGGIHDSGHLPGAAPRS